MTALIERLEAAETGSRELDAAIHDQMQWLQRPEDEPPAYTTSLDAAETLWSTPEPLPKRKNWRALQYWTDYRPGGKPYWRVKALECRGSRVFPIAIGDHRHKIIAANIAALKARQS